MLKNKFSLVSIVLAVTILAGALGTMNLYARTGPLAHIAVYAAGIPDSYGNRIVLFRVWQNTTGAWTTVTTVTYTTFTNGTTLSIPANQKTILEVEVVINSSLLTSDDVTTAKAQTRVYLTVSTVVTSTEMNDTYGGGAMSPGWYVNNWYPAPIVGTPSSVWTPSTDTTYTVTAQYQAYY